MQRPQRVSPNVFAAIPIDSPDIHFQIRKIQQRIINAVPAAKSLMESTRKSHITLCVACVPEKDLMSFSEAFTRISSEIAKSHITEGRNTIRLKGIGDFDRQRVIFAKVAVSGLNLNNVFKEVDGLFKDHGYTGLHADYTAHLTLMKAHGKHRLTQQQKIALSQIYREIEAEQPDFGVQTVKEIEFLHMMLPKDINGYYNKLASSTGNIGSVPVREYEQRHKNCCALPL